MEKSWTQKRYKCQHITYEFENIKEKINIIGIKEWIGGELLEGPRPDIQLQLYKDGKEHRSPVALVDGETEYTWKKLNNTNPKGEDHDCKVKEVNVPENYTKSEDGLKVINTYVSPKIEVTGEKVWIGGSSQRPTIELQLYRNGEAFGELIKLVNGKTKYIWENLDLTDMDGKAYIYTVDEINVPLDYTKEVSEDGLTVRNTAKPIDPEGQINQINQVYKSQLTRTSQ